MTNDAHRGIVGKAHSQALVSLVAAVGDCDETRVLAVSHTDASAMMKAHPGSPAGDTRREVQECPIGDCV